MKSAATVRTLCMVVLVGCSSCALALKNRLAVSSGCPATEITQDAASETRDVSSAASGIATASLLVILPLSLIAAAASGRPMPPPPPVVVIPQYQPPASQVRHFNGCGMSWVCDGDECQSEGN